MTDTDSKKQDEEAADKGQAPEKDAAPAKDQSEDAAGQSPKEPAWAADLDEYPLRDPAEDPRWAIRTVKVWLGVALFCLAGILTLLVLGFFHE